MVVTVQPSTLAWIVAVGAIFLLAIAFKIAIVRGLRYSGLSKAEMKERNSLRALYEGADGAASSSKFQWLVWTLVVIASYIAVYVSAPPGGIRNLSENVLLVMGLSSATMVAAKAITSNQVKTQVVKKNYLPRDQHKGGLVLDDEGYLDLSKAQLMAWTLVGVAIFLYESINAVNARTGIVPDISGQLVAFMGLGQGAYLAKKAAGSLGTKQILEKTIAVESPAATTVASVEAKAGQEAAKTGGAELPGAPTH